MLERSFIRYSQVSSVVSPLSTGLSQVVTRAQKCNVESLPDFTFESFPQSSMNKQKLRSLERRRNFADQLSTLFQIL